MDKNKTSQQPIGLFDSGIGGLTVARAVATHLPQENLLYFGDTAHLPYGDKSTAALQAYSIKIVDWLLQQQCKLILIACHSATAAAYTLLKEYVGTKALLVNVVDPVVQHLKTHYVDKRVGLIGTRQTVGSGIFERKLAANPAQSIQLHTHATNLLASAIEEFGDHPIMDSLLAAYLAPDHLQRIDALVLACTHYPIIQQRIARYYQNNQHQPIDIINVSDIVALATKQQLAAHQLLNTVGQGDKQFYISDYTDTFANNAALFFGEHIKLVHHPLWD